ncbi:MAG: polyprenyl synthetase family protein [Patescibacteria group bacterium]
MKKTDAARSKLKDFAKLMDEKLAEYWDNEISSNFGFNSKQKTLIKEMLLHSKEHNLRPAKRVRATFTYFSYLLKPGNVLNEKIIKACLALELVQTALLMHDDFMDQDVVRRGKPTTQIYFEKNNDKHYGESMAVTVGDAVLCLGFELLNDSGFDPIRVQKANAKMLRGIAQTAYGQAYDVTLEKLQNEWIEDDVISVHKAKTSIYTFENPLFIGAHLTDLPTETFPILHDYAMDGGVAFQLQDDILGIYGDELKTGKSADSDLLQGKCTLLVVKTLADGTKDQKEALMNVWGQRHADHDDIELAKKAIVDCGSLEYSKTISRSYAQKSAKTASKLRALGLNNESIEFLEGIAEYMVEREL